MNLPPHLQAQLDRIKEIESTMLLLSEHLKYPVDHQGHVLNMNYLPDVPYTLAHHLAKLGWRFQPEKALIKPRKVIGPGIPEDLVTYVPVDATDEPLYVEAPQPPQVEGWQSGPPKVTTIDEERK